MEWLRPLGWPRERVVWEGCDRKNARLGLLPASPSQQAHGCHAQPWVVCTGNGSCAARSCVCPDFVGFWETVQFVQAAL